MQILSKGGDEVGDLSFEQRAERLNQLFLDKIVPFYREVVATSLLAMSEEQFIESQTQEHLARNQKADLIKQKFELITREYD